MLSLLGLFLPFFALVLLGSLAVRWRWMPVEGVGGMNSFVLYFGLTALLFRAAADGGLMQSGLFNLLLIYGVAGLLVTACGLWCAVRAGVDRRDGGLMTLGATFPNSGFLGLPLLIGWLGEEAAGPVAATLMLDVLLASSVCLIWAHSSPGKGGGRGEGALEGALEGVQLAALWTAFQGALRNPLLWALVAGLLMAAGGWSLPGPLDHAVHLLSLAATPVALFTLGAMLARSRIAAAARDAVPVPDVGARRRLALTLTLIKLGLHPAAVLMVGLAFRAVGAQVPDAGLLAVVMAAALPSASNVSMLAEREGADADLVARLTLWTTACALLTLTVWARLLG